MSEPDGRVPIGVWESANDRAESWEATALRLALVIVEGCPDLRGGCERADHQEAHEVIENVLGSDGRARG